MFGVVITSPSSAIGPGCPTFAVVKLHQISLASSLRLNWTPMMLPSTAGVTLVMSISPPSKRTPTDPSSMRSLMSWPSVSSGPAGR